MGMTAPAPTTLFGRLGESAADAARAFLQRNAVPLRWIDVERDPVADLLRADELASVRLPLAVFPDGTRAGRAGAVGRPHGRARSLGPRALPRLAALAGGAGRRGGLTDDAGA